MIFNFSQNHQFNTRLSLEGKPLQQVSEARLLGVNINDRLSWDDNVDATVKKAYMRVPILHNLVSFEVPLRKLINIYILYIRLVLEQSATVWHSSLTCEETRALERVQKVCLKIIPQIQNRRHFSHFSQFSHHLSIKMVRADMKYVIHMCNCQAN